VARRAALRAGGGISLEVQDARPIPGFPSGGSAPGFMAGKVHSSTRPRAAGVPFTVTANSSTAASFVLHLDVVRSFSAGNSGRFLRAPPPQEINGTSVVTADVAVNLEQAARGISIAVCTHAHSRALHRPTRTLLDFRCRAPRRLSPTSPLRRCA
jgi:hypothetical protein